MGQKMYLRSDGNGGVNISKGAMALMTLIILLISCVASVVYANAQLQQIVKQNSKEIDDIKTNYFRSDVANAKLDAIQREITEIKDILKHG